MHLMEPTQEQAPAPSELPRPSVDGLPTPEMGGEQPVSSLESSSQPPSPSPSAPDPVSDTSAVGAPAGQAPIAQPISVADDAVLMADDADLIEKEWVARAKSVVEQTKADPFVQNKELNKVKADYIKKRYNRDIKVSE
jgi:hypothetical protein